MKEAFLVARCVPADVVMGHGQVSAQGRFEGMLSRGDVAEGVVPLLLVASRGPL